MTPPVRPFGRASFDTRGPARRQRRPRQYFGGGRQLPALVPDGCIDMGLLASFDHLMRRHGQGVRVQQMRYDRAYAFERIALGRGRNDAALRQLAMVLFDIYTGDGSD